MVGERVEKVDWNLKGSIIQHVAQHLYLCSMDMVRGNYSKAFRHLKSAKKIVLFKFSPEERESLKKKEKRLDIIFNAQSMIQREQSSYSSYKIEASRKHFILKMSKTPWSNLFDSYHEELMDSLDKYGFTMGVKEDDSSIGYD